MPKSDSTTIFDAKIPLFFAPEISAVATSRRRERCPGDLRVWTAEFVGRKPGSFPYGWVFFATEMGIFGRFLVENYLEMG